MKSYEIKSNGIESSQVLPALQGFRSPRAKGPTESRDTRSGRTATDRLQFNQSFSCTQFSGATLFAPIVCRPSGGNRRLSSSLAAVHLCLLLLPSWRKLSRRGQLSGPHAAATTKRQWWPETMRTLCSWPAGRLSPGAAPSCVELASWRLELGVCSLQLGGEKGIWSEN